MHERILALLFIAYWLVGCGVEDNNSTGHELPGGNKPTPVDLVATARITATATRATFLGLWPRETDDAAYTVRDGDLATGWKIPSTGIHTLTLDLAPLSDRMPVLASLESLWKQPPSGPVHVRARRYCGGEVLQQGYWATPSALYVFDPPVAAYCVELEVPGDTGKPSLSELHAYPVSDGRRSSSCLAEGQIRDTPGGQSLVLRNSGVVEGFYGRPWSHAERLAMIQRLASLGLGLYIYGPKNDPLHRDQWRVPYDEAAIARFTELRTLADRLSVTFSFGISPGKDMVMGDAGERAALIAKLKPFIKHGFRHCTLLLDDIESSITEPIDARLAMSHVDLANWLKDALGSIAGREVALWFVPTVYSTQRQNAWPGGSGYLDMLARLDPDIQVMWTGTDTLSTALGAADLGDVTARIGRRPVIWDNEHATDGGDAFGGKVYLAPYMGRRADLIDAVQGIVANPMILGAADRLVAGTYASFLHDPVNYSPHEAMRRAAELEGSDDLDRELLMYLADTFYGSGILGIPGINLPYNPTMEAAINDLQGVIPDGSAEEILAAGSTLLDVAAQMATAQNDMHHSHLEVSLVDDLWVPADRLTHEGHALLWLLDWVGSLLAGRPDESLLAQADSYLEEALADRYQLSLFRVNVLRRYLGRHQPPAMGFVAPSMAEPSSQPVAGSPWEYVPSSHASVRVYGLPGSLVEDGTVVWTPQHAGRYDAIVVALSETGWAWQELTLTVGYEE